nr:uncharacterized protein LOC111420163 isoform X2 [Onthophagus taurus]
MDMLSIRKVRLHGMKDSRWMTKDKITQYKGLINLFKRDKKISNSDKSVATKRDKRALATLKKEIAGDRDLLDNALYGDKQIIRNALLSDKRIQLAYERLEPHIIVEHLQQQKFNCRKKMDLMQFEKLQKAKRLVTVKLEYAELCDRLTFEQPGSFPVERLCREYTSHVQDAILKKEAAIVVNETYKKIISVMKKDQIYFDQILYCLNQDARKQAKCMFDTIMLGQLAIEYLDDRREDFRELEAAVQCDMTLRKQTVKSTRQVVESLSKNIKFYIRRDSDTNLPGDLFLNTNTDIEAEVAELCRTLDQLKEAFSVNYYLQLFDCLKEQDRQAQRLRALCDRTLEGRDTLQNRLNHANLSYTEMVNSVCDGTADYVEEKRSLLESLEYGEFRKKEAIKKREVVSTVLTNVKISLQQMEQMCKVVRDPKEKKVTPKLPSVEKSVALIKAARHPQMMKQIGCYGSSCWGGS